jgi:hypothetical protein
MPFCPQCGVDNPANARFCDQCGAALIPVPAPASSTPTSAMPPQPVASPAMTAASAAPAVPVTSGMVTCPQCGASAIPGEAFCDNCGAPLNAPARPVTQAPAPVYSAGVPPQPSYPPPQPSNYATAPAQTYPPAAPAQPYTPPPAASVAPPRTTLAPAQLIVAASGAALPLPATAQAIVGRGDPVSNFFPDLDLGPHGALDNGVGRRHLRVFLQGGQVLIEDLDSTNGTVLNGQKLVAGQPQPLRNGDQIIAGKLLLRFSE